MSDSHSLSQYSCVHPVSPNFSTNSLIYATVKIFIGGKQFPLHESADSQLLIFIIYFGMY